MCKSSRTCSVRALRRSTVSEDPDTGETVVEIREGSDAYPEVRIHAGGLQVSGPTPGGDGIGIRSDNDWLAYNFEGMEQPCSSDLHAQAKGGQFSRLDIRGGTMEMLRSRSSAFMQAVRRPRSDAVAATRAT